MGIRAWYYVCMSLCIYPLYFISSSSIQTTSLHRNHYNEFFHWLVLSGKPAFNVYINDLWFSYKPKLSIIRSKYLDHGKIRCSSLLFHGHTQTVRVACRCLVRSNEHAMAWPAIWLASDRWLNGPTDTLLYSQMDSHDDRFWIIFIRCFWQAKVLNITLVFIFIKKYSVVYFLV